MTFLELKTEAANRLNLSSTESLSRLGNYINQRYRRLTSSLGLVQTRRTTQAINTVAGTATITFTQLEHVDMVYCLTDGQRRVLGEMPYEEYIQKVVEQPLSRRPDQYAIKSVTPSTVTICLYPTPDAIYSITGDGVVNATTMSADADVPNIPVDFQDILILGAMSDELFKMEKYNLAKEFQQQYEQRASDLRLFLAKSAYISLTDAASPGGLVTVVRRRWNK